MKKFTQRGFPYYEFKDSHDTDCKIQLSSSFGYGHIWLGAKEIGLKEFVAYRQPEAWKDVQLEHTMEHHYVANNCMHLNRKQCKFIGLKLLKFWLIGKL